MNLLFIYSIFEYVCIIENSDMIDLVIILIFIIFFLFCNEISIFFLLLIVMFFGFLGICIENFKFKEMFIIVIFLLLKLVIKILF